MNIKTDEKCPCPGCEGTLGTNKTGVVWCYQCGRVYRDDDGVDHPYESVAGE